MEAEPHEASDSDLLRRLLSLEQEERALSARRRRLHDRIDFVRASGNADGSPVTSEQLEALDERERAISSERKTLHAQIRLVEEERERRAGAAGRGP